MNNIQNGVRKWGALLVLLITINQWIAFTLAYRAIYQNVNHAILYWWWSVHISILALLLFRIWSFRWSDAGNDRTKDLH